MAAHLTDKQKKKIIADYVNIGSYNAVAKKYKISATTVRKLVLNDAESVKKCEEKKDKNTKDIIDYLETQKNKVCEIIGIGLDVLCDREKLASANPAQITTALGTLIDKFTALSKNTPNTENNMQTLADLLNAPQPNRNIADYEDNVDE